MELIPQAVLDAYVARYPHFRTLAVNVAAGSRQAANTFAQNACRLESPRGVSASHLWALAGVANGGEWSEKAS